MGGVIFVLDLRDSQCNAVVCATAISNETHSQSLSVQMAAAAHQRTYDHVPLSWLALLSAREETKEGNIGRTNSKKS